MAADSRVELPFLRLISSREHARPSRRCGHVEGARGDPLAVGMSGAHLSAERRDREGTRGVAAWAGTASRQGNLKGWASHLPTTWSVRRGDSQISCGFVITPLISWLTSLSCGDEITWGTHGTVARWRMQHVACGLRAESCSLSQDG